MSKDSSRLPLPATWNTARTAWETDTLNLYCGHAEPSLGTWPPSGSMRNGIAWARTKSAPPTVAAASSSAPGPLLSTPVASDGGTDRGSSADWGLRDEARKLFKTPTSNLGTNGGSQHPDKRKQGGHGPTLADEVEHLLPTPAARDWKCESNLMDRNSRPLNEVVVNLLPTPTASNPNDGESWEARRQRNLAKGINGNGQGTPLAIAVKLRPTPRASDGEKGGPNQRGSKGDLMLPSAAAQLLPTPRATRGGSATETMYSLGAERTDLARPQGEVLLPTPLPRTASGRPRPTAGATRP
jgi:hypothetical protein